MGVFSVLILSHSPSLTLGVRPQLDPLDPLGLLDLYQLASAILSRSLPVSDGAIAPPQELVARPRFVPAPEDINGTRSPV